MASFQAKTGQERLRKREKKIIVPISSYPTQNREFQKTSKKIQKIKKHHYDFFSSQNGSGLVEKEKKENYCSDQLLPDQKQKIPKKQLKNSKN